MISRSYIGPCHWELGSCSPPVVWLVDRTGGCVELCRACLDSWFDTADDAPELEPLGWGWLRKEAVSHLPWPLLTPSDWSKVGPTWVGGG